MRRFGVITPARKGVITVCAVACEPLDLGVLCRILTEIGEKTDSGRRFSLKMLNEYVSELVKKGFLEVISAGVRCRSTVRDCLCRRLAEGETFKSLVEVINRCAGDGSADEASYGSLLRSLRCAVYAGDLREMRETLIAAASSYPDEFYREHPLLSMVMMPFDEEWFAGLPAVVQVTLIEQLLEDSLEHFYGVEELFDFALTFMNKGGREVQLLRTPVLVQLCLRARIGEAKELLGRGDMQFSDVGKAGVALLDGERDACAVLKGILEAHAVVSGYDALFAAFYFAASVNNGSNEKLVMIKKLIRRVKMASDSRFSHIFGLFERTADALCGDKMKAKMLAFSWSNTGGVGGLERFFHLLCLLRLPGAGKMVDAEEVERFCCSAERAGYRFAAFEAAGEAVHAGVSNPTVDALSTMIRRQTGCSLCLSGVIPDGWHESLEALAALTGTAVKPKRAQRLVWRLRLHKLDDSVSVHPFIQKEKVGGGWSSGKSIALKRLYGEPDMEFLSDSDIAVCHCICMASAGSYSSKVKYELDAEEALPHLIGHPYLYWDDAPAVHFDLVPGKVELHVEKRGENVVLELDPNGFSDRKVILVRDSISRVRLIRVTDQLKQIAGIIGNGLAIPFSAGDQVASVISGMSDEVDIFSDVEFKASKAKICETDSRTRLRLSPVGEGLKVELFVNPFGADGPTRHPGEGGEKLVVTTEAGRKQVLRDFQEEMKLASHVTYDCPTLSLFEEEPWCWVIPSPDACLEFLLELQAIEDQVLTEWPRGRAFRHTKEVGGHGFDLNFRKENKWYVAEGELKVDENLVVPFRTLLKKLRDSSSRFIRLESGEFLCLTREFRRRLDQMAAFGEIHDNDVRFHPVSLLALNELTLKTGEICTDSHWLRLLAKYKQAMAIKEDPPKGLKAELRPYQLDGYQWLCRTAAWGGGACLADDMGLGKTVQGLALALHRSEKGPTLVVCPTSVCSNWISECKKFTPSLRTHTLYEADRKQLVEGLEANDVLLVSYSMLQIEVELLTGVQWETIILDEAQMIKNISAKRARAAMGLKGKFRMVTTGTPLENHLSELWTIFRFLNPGLLGSKKSFNTRFASAIERNQDTETLECLKKLLSPFMLRRTKGEVLKELPPRTEIVLDVELSSGEKALYEATRREALKRLSSPLMKGGERRLSALAEIMRLRRVCCNPRLVVPETEVLSSKLQLFGEVVEELLENKHKALVFSQFVGHLELIRNHLDVLNIHYQYLDGSTPVKERQKRIDAFQKGEGDLFLISLKAGGFGLNLTAADYVFHMDPWWNPAVEDQASDRAHRIGQTRPVTVYRFVCKNTIEEKILELHERKRELADSVLGGAVASAKITAEDIIRLIRD